MDLSPFSFWVTSSKIKGGNEAERGEFGSDLPVNCWTMNKPYKFLQWVEECPPQIHVHLEPQNVNYLKQSPSGCKEGRDRNEMDMN